MADRKLRPDGRQPLELRAPSCQLALLNRADGSAKFSMGKSSVLAAVYGPMEVKARNELMDRAFIDVVFKPKSGIPGFQHREIELALKGAADQCIIATLHPRTEISIIVQVLSEDGSLFATCLNAVTLALMDAGVPLLCVLAAVTVSVDGKQTVLLDPVEEEESSAQATFAWALSSTKSTSTIAASLTNGSFEQSLYFNTLKQAELAAEKMVSFFRIVLTHKHSST